MDDVAVLVLQRHFADPFVAVPVEWAEAGGNADAKHGNTDGSIDRGLWQINSRWHPQVTDAQAYHANASDGRRLPDQLRRHRVDALGGVQ